MSAKSGLCVWSSKQPDAIVITNPTHGQPGWTKGEAGWIEMIYMVSTVCTGWLEAGDYRARIAATKAYNKKYHDLNPFLLKRKIAERKGTFSHRMYALS